MNSVVWVPQRLFTNGLLFTVPIFPFWPLLAQKVPMKTGDLGLHAPLSQAGLDLSWRWAERCVLTVLILELMQLYSKRLKACSEGCRKLRKGSSPDGYTKSCKVFNGYNLLRLEISSHKHIHHFPKKVSSFALIYFLCFVIRTLNIISPL